MNSQFVFMSQMVQAVLEFAVFSIGGVLVMFLITAYLQSKGQISDRVGKTLGELRWMLFLAV